MSSRDVEQLPEAKAPEYFPPGSLIGICTAPSIAL